MSLDVASMRLESLEFRTEAFIDSICVDVFIREVQDPLKEIATSKGHAQRFIDSIQVKKMAFMTPAIGLGYTDSKGNPLGIWLEKGTKPHRIPKLGKVTMLKFYWEKLGKWVKFPHVMHPGFIGYHLLDELPPLMQRYANEISKQTNIFLEKTRFK